MRRRYFFDTSSIVKRYVREPGADWVRATCEPRTRPPLYLAEIARVEGVAALCRHARLHGLDETYLSILIHQFEHHYSTRRPQYTLVPISSSVLTIAADLCRRYRDTTPFPLRSLDAVQLASAKAVAATLSDELVFVVSDMRLGAIAALEGLRVLDPAHPPQP